MKKSFLTGVALMMVLFVDRSVTAQNIDQLKEIKKFQGAWQANRGRDTVEIWDFIPYGSQDYIVDIYQLSRGKKTPVSFNPISYNAATGKFYGFTLLASGNYGTWVGSFTTETKFDGDMLTNFNPQPVYGRLVNIFKNPNEWTWMGYTPDGIKFLQLDFVKVKKQ
jgi:hypothetical protein